jgi:hypothetical protein
MRTGRWVQFLAYLLCAVASALVLGGISVFLTAPAGRPTSAAPFSGEVELRWLEAEPVAVLIGAVIGALLGCLLLAVQQLRNLRVRLLWTVVIILMAVQWAIGVFGWFLLVHTPTFAGDGGYLPALRQSPGVLLEDPIWVKANEVYRAGHMRRYSLTEIDYYPWPGDLPVDPSTHTLLVLARFQTEDGRALLGTAQPDPAETDPPGAVRTTLVEVDGALLSCWVSQEVLRWVRQDQPEATAESLAGELRQVWLELLGPRAFPLGYELPDGLLGCERSGRIDGVFWEDPAGGVHLLPW